MLEKVLSLGASGFAFHVGAIVRTECGPLAGVLDQYEEKGHLTILSGQSLSASRFAKLLADYELGDGETECLAHAEASGLTVCSDGMAARSAVELHFKDKSRVVGSLRLIRESVCAKLISSSEGYVAYELMKSKGAFLPEVQQAYFEC